MVSRKEFGVGYVVDGDMVHSTLVNSFRSYWVEGLYTLDRLEPSSVVDLTPLTGGSSYSLPHIENDLDATF